MFGVVVRMCGRDTGKTDKNYFIKKDEEMPRNILTVNKKRKTQREVHVYANQWLFSWHRGGAGARREDI